MSRSSSTWRDVTPKDPCPVCGHTDWCSVARDGLTVLCRREPAWNGRQGKHRVDDLGDLWSYGIRGAGNPSASPSTSASPAPADCPPCASEADRDRVYRLLLGRLDLSREHRVALKARGLVDAEIERRGYRTLGPGRARVAREVLDQVGEDLLQQVPGFYRQTDPAKPDKAPWWSIAGQSGLLVPVRDLGGQVCACKIRLDQEAQDGGRYRTLSSTAHHGPGPGSLVHVPLSSQDRPAGAPSTYERVRLTEGELKADVTTALDREGVLTLSVPGVGAWRRAGDVLKGLGAKVVRLAFDRDAWVNWRVAGALSRAAETLRTDYELEMETW